MQIPLFFPGKCAKMGVSNEKEFIAMQRVLSGLQPEKFFTYFEDISRIPRSSYEEKAVSDYVVAFAKEHNLEVYQDEVWNVIINKPATPGYEDRKGIILQGHLDMVCVADEGVVHDFSKDPIELMVDGEWVTANGTTLGADNGTAIAMMLMLLDEDTVPHPAIQCIFTTTEEIGMEGVAKLDGSKLQGSYLINLDGGGYRKLLLSSAGASNHLFKIERELHAVEDAENKQAYRITVGGMTSGHSGGMANKCMGNAIQILGSFLNVIADAVPMELANVVGGLKMNAIAKQAEAEIIVPADCTEKLETLLTELTETLRREYSLTDPNAFMKSEKIEMPAACCSTEAQEKILAFLDLLFDGTYRFMTPEKAMAKTSCNIGVLSNIGTQVVADCLMRSNSDFFHQELGRKTDRMAKLLGIEHVIKNDAPAWEYDPESSLVKLLMAFYQKELGETPEIVMTHGGMEPGSIIGLGKSVGKKIEAMNMGVKSEGAHTTAERMNIPAVAETYEWLKKILINLD